MSTHEIPTRAIDLILERGVRFRLPAPFYKQLLRLNQVTIRPPLTGTVFLICREALAYELSDTSLLLTETPTPNQVEGVTRVVAIAVLGRKAVDEERLTKLAKKLEAITWASLLELYSMVKQLMRVEDFRSTTASVAMTVTSLMRVKKRKGRQEDEL